MVLLSGDIALFLWFIITSLAGEVSYGLVWFFFFSLYNTRFAHQITLPRNSKPWERKVIDRLWHNIKVGKSHRNDSSGINDEGVSGDLLFARAVITLPQLIFFHLL